MEDLKREIAWVRARRLRVLEALTVVSNERPGAEMLSRVHGFEQQLHGRARALRSQAQAVKCESVEALDQVRATCERAREIGARNYGLRAALALPESR